MYGLSGASGKVDSTTLHKIRKIITGRHNCLWCLIKSEELKTPQAQCSGIAKRTLSQIKADHQRFLDAGANHQKAKEFNNVMAPHFFDIDITQVI